ncbi:MAGUK p55 subfamily member 4-like isoform X3 [Erpetoichthys calabaricus]|uniref:MAGUK p55 subfamily member 4-like isoform X3 n=1 Tax=Erpetoichthys calabaricus TaxID=27687 RepID=UPI0022346607|nr:MAGUK p55 subfamily member 4-like isoform X3 [Erpetoichthys calabaricus]
MRQSSRLDVAPALSLCDNGLSQILAMVVEEVRQSVNRDINGAALLYSLLNAPWLRSLLKVYECLQLHLTTRPPAVLNAALPLTREVVMDLRLVPTSPDVRELQRLLMSPHLQALLSAHDMVAQKDYEPVLPPLPGNLPEDEEAMRIVCLVKNKQPLGATIKRNEVTGDIVVARIIHGGLADRSGLLHAGDTLVEVNGIGVDGLDPEEVIQILAQSQGTIVFKLIPISDCPVSSQTMLYVRAMASYCPQQDPAIPCADAGVPFRKGDILEVVDQTDMLWWQARKLSDHSTCAGLIPSSNLLRRKQREFWWSQPLQPHTCMKSSSQDDTLPIDERCVETADEEAFESGKGAPRRCVPLCLLVCPSARTSALSYVAISSSLCAAEDDEFNGFNRGVYIAGFHRSFRLCRRKSQSNHQPCYVRCPASCYSAMASPYEEVVRYQRHPEDRYRLIVLMGPSGVGVNELRRRLIEINPQMFQGPVPHTTRPPKSYEEVGREYHFVPRETFEQMVYNHRFLEFGQYKGNWYGTSVEAVKVVLDSRKICVIDLEPQVIQGMRTHELKPYIIFIKPPSISQMRQTRRSARIVTEYYTHRPFKEEDLQEMEEAARWTESQYCQFFDHVIVNETLQDACVHLLTAVRRAQDEPQWVPASWLRPESQS